MSSDSTPPTDQFPCSRPNPNQRVIEHTFRSVLVGDLFAHKMAGFAEHFNAKIRKAEYHHVRMQVGARGFLGSNDRGNEFPVDVQVTLHPLNNSNVFEVHVKLRPIAIGVPKRFCQTRYESILRELHAFLIPQLTSMAEYQLAS